MPTKYGGVPGPKPEPRQRAKARVKRQESSIIAQVRAACVERDGECRAANRGPLGPCSGASEWAHLASHRRYQTRGQAPAQRHTTAGTLMLCTWHHQAYDAHCLEIDPLDPALGADGVLRIRQGNVSVLSVPRTK